MWRITSRRSAGFFDQHFHRSVAHFFVSNAAISNSIELGGSERPMDPGSVDSVHLIFRELHFPCKDAVVGHQTQTLRGNV